MKKIFLVALLFGISLTGSCASVSNSLDQVGASLSGSVSNAVGSLSRSVSSISKSSGGDSADSRIYKKDIKTLVAIYANDEERIANLEKDMERIAHRHGFIDWRSMEATYSAIGSGLKIAGYNKEQVKSIAEKAFANKPSIQEAMLSGYNL